MASGAQRDIEANAHLSRTVGSETWYFARSEQAFITSEELSNASINDTATLTLSNPTDSGVTAVFSLIQPAVLSRSYVRVHDEFDTSPTGGTMAGVENVLLDSAGGAPDTGVVTARTGDTYTESGTHVAEPLAGGSGGQAVGDARNMPVLALEPGRDTVVEVEKLADGPNPLSITVRWFEVERVFSETTTTIDPSEVY